MSSPTAGPPAGLPTVTRFLVLIVAAIGFLFDTYELLMFPVTGAAAISELLNVPVESDQIRLWSGRMLWIAALSGGVFGLLGGWMIDRLGQSRVVVPATIVSTVAFTMLIAAAHLHWPVWTLFASALGAAVLPSMSAIVRARWTELFRGRPELNTAFAFESAADELLYISGASLSVGLSVALFPEAGMAASTLLLAAGSRRTRNAGAENGQARARIGMGLLVNVAVRRDCQRLAVVGDGLGEVAALLVDHASAAEGGGMVPIEHDGGVEVGRGLVEHP